MWLLYAVGSAVFAGTTAVFAKIGIRQVNSHLATALRTVVVLVFAWAMVFAVGSQRTIGEIGTRSLLFLILSGLATGASWLCYFRALQLGDMNKVAPIDKSSTVLTMLLAFRLLHETLTIPKALCMVGIAAGTLLMVERRDVQPLPAAGKGWLPYAVLSAVFASLTAILGKVGIAGVESNLGTAIRTAVVLAMAWGIVFLQGTQDGIARIDRRSWVFIALSGAATGLSWLCYFRALQSGPASVVVPVDKLSILVTAALGRLVFGERLGGKPRFGLALITAGTVVLVLV